MSGRRLASAAIAAGILFSGAAAFGQPVVQAGSSGEASGVREEWVLGVGYNFDFPVLPFEVGGLLQAGTGVATGAGGREFPLRGFLTARVGMFPAPGFGAYLGAGAGAAIRFGGDREAGTVPAGIGFAGIEVGRVHLEVQLQREFHEEPMNRWVTAVGVTF